jgi:hypothetical protein
VTITLTKQQIDQAISRVEPGLRQYLWLQKNRDSCNIDSDADYQRKFNRFYRVRRKESWRDSFYELLEAAKKRKRARFPEILHALYRATNRCEASFASKLAATIDTNLPVIDSIILRNLNLRLPTSKSNDRLAGIADLHEELGREFRCFLSTDQGRYLVRKFRLKYPGVRISEVKMLDLVLWQTR